MRYPADVPVNPSPREADGTGRSESGTEHQQPAPSGCIFAASCFRQPYPPYIYRTGVCPRCRCRNSSSGESARFRGVRWRVRLPLVAPLKNTSDKVYMIRNICYTVYVLDESTRPREVAQLGSAPASGAGGRGFKSRLSDH